MTPEHDRKIKERFTPKTWNETKTNDSWAIFKIMSEFVNGSYVQEIANHKEKEVHR